jgi:hypothetical protein
VPSHTPTRADQVAPIRPSPVSSNPRRSKSLLLLFFRKEDSSFSEEKEAKRLYFLVMFHDACSLDPARGGV